MSRSGSFARILATTALAVVALACGAPDGERAIEVDEDLRLERSPVLLEAARSGIPEERLRAVRAMGRIQSASYVDVLARAVDDDAPQVRLGAIFALGQLGLAQGQEVPDEAVRTVLGVVDDPDPEVVATAAEALGKLASPQAIGPLIELLGRESPAVRSAAAYGLFRCRFAPLWRQETEEPVALPDDAVEALVTAIGDPDVEVRRAAVYAFSRYGEPRAGSALVDVLEDEDEWTRLFAARAIGRSGTPRPFVAEGVSALLTDPSPRVRTEAVAALGAIERTDLLTVATYEDASFHVRAAAARALATAKGSGNLTILRRFERDGSSSVRTAAIEALAERLGAGFLDRLAVHLKDPEWTIRVAATRAARHVGSGRLLVLDRALQDDDPRVRAAAIESLGDLEGVDAILIEALASTDLAVRGTAIELVADREDPQALPWLAEAYASSAGVEWIEIREGIADAVGELSGATDLLTRIAVEDPVASVRSRAARALEKLGEAVPEVRVPPGEPSPFLGRVPERDPVVVLDTTRGEIEIRCLAREAPVHVASFLERVRSGFYDGLIWHRVVSNFVIQGGDPLGNGWGGPGYAVRDEISTERFERGTVGMPKAGKDTGGCQIFVTHVPTPHLDGNYTVYGRVTRGLEVLDAIEVGDRIVRARVEP